MTDDNDFTELQNRIEQSELDAEDLALVSESRLEEMRDNLSTLRQERKEPYAEALAEVSGMSTDLLMDNDYEALKAEYDERLEELEEEDEDRPEELNQTLDPTPKAQETETEELEEEDEDSDFEDLSSSDKQDLKELASQIETYEDAGGPWADAAERSRGRFEDLAGAEYGEVEVADL